MINGHSVAMQAPRRSKYRHLLPAEEKLHPVHDTWMWSFTAGDQMASNGK